MFKRSILLKLSLITLSLMTIALVSSCSDDDGDLSPNNPNNPNPGNPNDTISDPNDTVPTPQLSTFELLTEHTWELYETYRDGMPLDTSSSSNFIYTANGSFLFEVDPGNWTSIGFYTFNQDSTAINLRFTGTSNFIPQELTVLTERELHTSFNTNGSDFFYKYRR